MFVCLESLTLSFTCNFLAYFKFHNDWGRVIGKIKQNELDCRDTASLSFLSVVYVATDGMDANSLRGRRSKGKGKGIKAQDHGRGLLSFLPRSPHTLSRAPKFPLPLSTPATQARMQMVETWRKLGQSCHSSIPAKLLSLVLPDKFDRYLLQNSTGAFYVWVKALRGRPLNFWGGCEWFGSGRKFFSQTLVVPL